MNYKIAVVPGDGISPEVVEQTVNISNCVGGKFKHVFEYEYLLAGRCAVDRKGTPFPDEILEACKKVDAVLLGAVGGPKWDDSNAGARSEQVPLGLRGGMNLYYNLKSALLYAPLKDASPLKDNTIGDGINICVVRKLTGGIYFGERGRENLDGVSGAYDTERYSINETKRIAKIAFDTAIKRKKKLTSVDKANILETSRLRRGVIEEVAKNYPEVEVNHMYVDNAAMQLVRDPRQLDITVTSNVLGDILSDEVSMITGSIGTLPLASLGEGILEMYELIHGSAPDIAGKGVANPLATVLSAAMMLKFSPNLEKEAKLIEDPVVKALEEGYRIGDIMSGGMKLVGTKEIGELISEKMLG